jgi:hypothetical protein
VKRWLVLAIALAACSRSPEKVEADEVKAAIDRLRRVDQGDLERTRALLGELEKKPATLAEARQARDACADAYRLFVDALEIMVKAKPKVKAKAELSDAELGRTTEELDLAQKKLDAANLAMPKCDEASAALTVALSH